MRGNELIILPPVGVADTTFRIPMRGNEYTKASTAAVVGVFRIPMRGNESLTAPDGSTQLVVSNPHEG